MSLRTWSRIWWPTYGLLSGFRCAEGFVSEGLNVNTWSAKAIGQIFRQSMLASLCLAGRLFQSQIFSKCPTGPWGFLPSCSQCLQKGGWQDGRYVGSYRQVQGTGFFPAPGSVPSHTQASMPASWLDGPKMAVQQQVVGFILTSCALLAAVQRGVSVGVCCHGREFEGDGSG